MHDTRDRGKKEPQIGNGSEHCFAGPMKMNRNNFSTDSLYWVGQNVYSGFHKTLQKSLSELLETKMEGGKRLLQMYLVWSTNSLADRMDILYTPQK